MSHPHEELLVKFYSALAKLDSQTMQECYHPESTFTDPVFGELTHEETLAMWDMLCKRAENFSLTYNDVKADDLKGSCHWEATYTFSKTKRTVHNSIDSEFEFKEGLIYRQKDTFDLWKWSRQALGTVGLLLGWFAPFQYKIREEALLSLRNRMNKAN